VAELNKSLEVIEKTSLDGAETVRRILEFSRKREDDKYFTEVDLNKIIEDALEFTKVRWKEQAEANGIKFKIKKDLSPLVSIAGSTSDLREVFINIFNNAIDAMSQGGNITIQTLQENSHITAYVKDSGIGIPEPIRDMIFDPFFTTKGVESTGLGLSVSYGIITRHRGTITVDRTEGQGTTFSIRLPLSENIIKENKPQPISRTQRKARILVIEDEKEVRELLYDILTGEGHEVETAPNGREGMKIFKKGEFDLIFTDLGMPGMTGLQVAEAIKKTNTKTPVILITGWELQLKDSELKKSGINLVVNKPFKVEQVLRLVQECEKKAISKAKSKK
jgi:CheY-like chemotaxis protein/anti-sigma regulatory factor (Ser/Thr protein kinase)